MGKTTDFKSVYVKNQLPFVDFAQVLVLLLSQLHSFIFHPHE